MVKRVVLTSLYIALVVGMIVAIVLAFRGDSEPEQPAQTESAQTTQQPASPKPSNPSQPGNNSNQPAPKPSTPPPSSPAPAPAPSASSDQLASSGPATPVLLVLSSTCLGAAAWSWRQRRQLNA